MTCCVLANFGNSIPLDPAFAWASLSAHKNPEVSVIVAAIICFSRAAPLQDHPPDDSALKLEDCSLQDSNSYVTVRGPVALPAAQELGQTNSRASVPPRLAAKSSLSGTELSWVLGRGGDCWQCWRQGCRSDRRCWCYRRDCWDRLGCGLGKQALVKTLTWACPKLSRNCPTLDFGFGFLGIISLQCNGHVLAHGQQSIVICFDRNSTLVVQAVRDPFSRRLFLHDLAPFFRCGRAVTALTACKAPEFVSSESSTPH